MTLKELASKIAKTEGKKHQASIGDVREVISLLRKLIKEDPSVLSLLAVKSKKK
jgi:3-deoxy-D-manno-octulosonic-acid transferase